jgi:hypothetical protein
MLKNESAQNPTKPTPLRPSRLPDSGGIFTLSNGVRMEKISHSVRKVKQAKNLLTVQSVQSVRTLTWQVRTGHVASPYKTRGRSIQTRGKSVQDTWRLQVMTRVRQIWTFWAYGWTNPEVTRVTTGRVTRGTG